MTYKPMLAGKADLAKLRFPLLASPKLDGVRATIIDGQLRSRSLKPFANLFTQAKFSTSRLDGLDGEFTLGSPVALDVYRRTNQALATIQGEPALTFNVFDDWLSGGAFQDRLQRAEVRASNLNSNLRLDIARLRHVLVHDQSELDQLEHDWTTKGYEGVMLRDPHGPYKHGRSTPDEGWLLKLKRMTSDEAEVIGVVEEMHNTNEATTNELGRTKRSAHKEGKVGKNTLGALHVRDLKTGVEFHIGTGFTAADRAHLWREPPLGKIVTYNHFEVGRKD